MKVFFCCDVKYLDFVQGLIGKNCLGRVYTEEVFLGSVLICSGKICKYGKIEDAKKEILVKGFMRNF